MKALLHFSLALLVLFLSACEPGGDTTKLKQQIEKNRLSIVSLTIKPQYTQTLDPVSAAPATPQYYFDHNDTEQLQVLGLTESNEEVELSGVSWSLEDTTDSTGKTTIAPTGLLTTETLAASQTKQITVNADFAGLKASADIIISSHPLVAGGLSIKLNDLIINNTTQTVVVCDTTSLKAEGLFEDGSRRDITSKIDWSAALSDTNARFIPRDPNNAVFTSHTNGSYTLSPSYKSQASATLDLLVAQTGFDNLSIDPGSVTLTTGNTYALQLNADIDSGSGSINRNITQYAKWSSADPSVFTVSNAGLLSGMKAGGPLDVTATCGSASISSSVTVNDENPVMSVKIRDVNLNVITGQQLYFNNATATGETINLKLIAILQDGTEVDVTTDTDTIWTVRTFPSLGDPISVDNADNKGLVSAIATGTAEVVATYQNHDDDLVVVVTAN